jgi:CelD/BcsL family acetyltransferase involved in cellulose biosynthesis
MHVEVIEGSGALERIRSDWDAVYRADPEAQLFLSWTWIKAWIDGLRGRWFILGVKTSPSSPGFVAFLPLRWRTKMRLRGGFYSEIVMAGSRMADYTGVICRPEHETAAIAALGEHLCGLSWGRLEFDKVRMTDGRLSLLLGSLSRAGISTIRKPHQMQAGIDLNVCPYIALPGSWDAYLATLSANTRQKLRRVLRRIEGSPELSVTVATEQTVERDIDRLLALWGAKWGAHKAGAARSIESNIRLMLLHCMRMGILFMPMLWRDDTLLGGLAILVDHEKKAMLFLVAGRDAGSADPPPGLALHAFSIRHAIACGFEVYDFLTGDEKYKLSLAQATRRIEGIEAERRRDSDRLLDRRGIGGVVQYCDKLMAREKPDLAAAGYSQVLALEPHNPAAVAALRAIELERRRRAEAQSLPARAVAAHTLSGGASQ